MKPNPHLHVLKVPTQYTKSNYSFEYKEHDSNGTKFPNYIDLRGKPNLTVRKISF